MSRHNRLVHPRLAILEDRTLPATFIVDTLADGGLGSLREGVLNCNTTAAPDTITFDPSLFGTIKLTLGQINITQPVSIIGTGSFGLTISGNNASRIFDTTGAPAGAFIRISDLTLTAGNAQAVSGGAINAGDQNLQLTDCVLSNNTAGNAGGAVRITDGSLTATRCRFTGNSAQFLGGAVYAFNALPTAIFRDCEFASNQASSGGAMYVNGRTIVEDCTFSANSATGVEGGAIFWNPADDLSLVNSTFSKNTAFNDGGAIHRSSGVGKLDVDNCTFTLNTATNGDGGAIHISSAGSTTVDSSIISGNNAKSGDDISSPSPLIMYHSAVGSSSGFAFLGSNNLPFGADLKLGVLGNNGGPTKTHRPADTSPVINAGSNGLALQFDQRGVTRVIGGAADIGAFEVPTTLIVTNANNSGAGSLRQVVTDANIDPVADIVTFDFVFFSTPRTIALTGSEIPITDNVSIFGPALGALTVDGGFNHRAFNMSLPALVVGQLYISGMGLTNCRGIGDGGAILSNRPVTLFGVGLTGNRATDNGGAVWAPEVTASYSVFTSNIAENDGGAVSANVLTANDCVFQNNSAVIRAGAIDVYNLFGGNLDLWRCNMVSNSAPTAGGIYCETALTLDQTTVAYCKANTQDAGGIYLTGANAALIRNSTISNNTSFDDGAGVALVSYNGTLTVQNSTVAFNSTSSFGDGAGIARLSGTGTINLESCIVWGNVDPTAPDLKTTGTVNATACLIGSKTGVTTFNADAKTLALLGADAKLGPLTLNGGPTQTHFLMPGSPAIDAGSNPAPAATFDQRGAIRAWGAAIDIGALEVQSNTAFVVDLVADESDGVIATGDLSLREAAEIASAALESSDSITFDPVVFAGTKTITLILGQVFIGGPVEIFGTGADRLTVSGNTQGRVFHLYGAPPATDITISDLTIADGRTYGIGGGMVMSAQDLTLNRCVFVNNASINSNGGALAQDGGTVTAVDCTFSGNTAAGFGGAIASLAPVTLLDCTLSGNSAQGGGGAVWLNGTSGAFNAIIRNSTLSGNSTNVDGGAVAMVTFDGLLTVQNSTITANTTPGFQAGQGGGIARISGTGVISIESSIVAGNTNPFSPDIFSKGTVNVNFSLVGVATGFTLTGANNLSFGTDPKLAPLADNGGPTLTHALKAGSPCIGKGSNPAGLATDQRGTGFLRVANGAVDIGAVEAAAPAKVISAGITGAPVQRSRVTSVTVEFDQTVDIPNPSAAIDLRRQSDSLPVALTFSIDNSGPATIVTLTFNGALSEFGSLADGRYTLRIIAAQVAGGYFDGNGDGLPGDNYSFASAGTGGIFRLFGDNDGDGDVDATDFGQFRQAFGTTTNLAFDFDNDGDVDASDFGQFRQRFGTSV